MENRTGITIIQHPRERHHPIGTARFLQLGLSNVELLEDTASCLRVPGMRAPVPPKSGVLYPSADARDLAELAPSERPEHLVVIDGTWHQAKTLYRDVTWLRDLPHYKFTPSTPSRYRIRREPRADYVSTLEATLAAVSLIEPELGALDDLLGAFDAMIDAQIERIGSSGERRVRTHRRPVAYRGLPRGIFEDYSRLVVIYAEGCSRQFLSAAESGEVSPTARFELHDAQRKDGELLYFAAYRLATQERFEALLSPSIGKLNERHLVHMCFSEAERESLSPPISFAEFRTRWDAFVRRDDVYAAWNQSALRWLDQSVLSKRQQVLLKAAYRRLERCGGALEEIAAAEGFEAIPLPFAGRSRERMGNALGLLEWLRRIGQE